MYVGTAAAGAVVLSLLAGTPARADSKTLGAGPITQASEAYALMEAQVPIDRLIERIQAADKGGSGSGLAGLRSDPARHALEVYWHGDLPANVSHQLTTARAEGITITVTPAPYTRDELLAETQRLAELNMIDDAAEVQLARIGPKVDGSGLDVGVSGLDRSISSAQVPSLARRLLPDLDSTYPLAITVAERPQLMTRLADTAPFWGGALMIRTVSPVQNAYCSTGFGVTGNNGAATYILTANHCGHGQWRTGHSLPIGNTIAAGVDHPHDTQLLLGGGAGNRIYTGDYFNGANQSSRPILGTAPNAAGVPICTSGSFSGQICGITINTTGVTANVAGYGIMTGLVEAQHPSLPAAGQGDSGGPAVSVIGSGGVFARGTLSLQDPALTVPCTGYPTVPNFRQCSRRIFFPDITSQLNGVGVRLNTG